MPRERLHKILQDLRRELDSTEALTDQDRSMLSGVVDRIRDTIDDSEGSKSENGSVLDSLDSAALHFEAEHPLLTKTLYQISEILRSAGLT
ncbi:MAG TPA: DUF4404 family protein [Rhodothermales bacterium]|nr:DUF4404 family protein [Rhodothermales bacterium]